MATQTCGKTTVSYDNSCGYSCHCEKDGCSWIIACPDGKGGLTYTQGTGMIATPPKRPQVTLAGPLEICAKLLERYWKRPVIVPENLRGKKIRTRKLSGTPEEMARALGLELGARRKR